MTAYTKGAKRRRKKAQISLPGAAPRPQLIRQGRRADLDDSPPPIMAARATRCPLDAASTLNESDMGRCILALSSGQERADMANTWAAISAARRNYLARHIGQTGEPKGAAIAMVPDAMETDPSLRVDMRTADERDIAAKRAWDAWHAKIAALPAPQMIWGIRGALNGFLGEGRLWHDRKPTAIGVSAVSGLKLLTTGP